ncbi:transferrin receptor-like dimerization domain-containing protein [Sphingomonas nostoxanthinifaciens]|uniref:transferrin receptor-like dimerization domain-containing protein n=1 Tax=Sphingomonas nostoxanthinifaciens TaxID=2872652 RepID=UPI001CC1D956|nr:transferrin receptor-like dimerization domain-containing protein [Sphingomonas nostoxanthinifaciens]UAK26298.1 M28 family peptidase [Sphingomonas nostoxanthinifaciens]
MRYSGRIWAGACMLALATGAIAKPMSQQEVEAAFDARIDPADLQLWLKDLSSAPNNVGSPHDKANADYMLRLFKSWGWDAHIETFSILYPKPISTTIEMIAPDAVKLGGQEPPIAGDETSTNTADALPPYVAYQGDGDVTADLVYVNYGMPEDYDALARRGIDVRGKIVIARYGSGWRGLKPKLAQDHGAAGCIIYSDPAEDGYAKDDVYPKGGMRPPESVQRGSVMDMPIYPGDPLTPGVGATPGAKRLTRAEATTILKIPALPMSWGDAQKLLAKLGGPAVPGGWQGALPFTYHTGGEGGVKVHLAVKSDWKMTDIYDVVATMKGSTYPDEWVVRGNHHDGWVMGANDPLSGNVAMMGEMKALGALAKQGWRPKRTLVYASWDGEEPSLLGSTEWAETHADELKAKGVIYINSDNSERGFFHAEGSHDFQHMVTGIAADVADPETGATILKRSRAATLVGAYETKGGRNRDAAAVAAAEKGGDLPLGALGSGSDYSAYLQHLGLPALDLGFGGEGESGGVYHSLYDSYHHLVTFDDPGLKYGAALAKVAGRAVLRVADADTPPMRFGDFADTVATYLDEVKKLADSQREKDGKFAKLLGDDSFRLAGDPLKPVAPPAPVSATTPTIDMAALDAAVAKLKASATAFDSAYADLGAKIAPAQRTKLNGQLRSIDQLLLDARGLPGRPWYRHMIYAPGRFTGYGAKTLPGVREAIEERRFADATTYVGITAKAIDAYAARLDQARATLMMR